MHNIWKYLIQDFLEISCRMDNDEAELILQAYQQAKPVEQNLEVHPAFSLGCNMTIVLKTAGIKELWVYDPEKKRIEKVRLGEKYNCYR